MNGISALAWVALICAIGSALILVTYLVKRPALTRGVKLWLLVGIGVLPLGAATSGNVSGLAATQTRTFCGSCHVMEPWTNDAADPRSSSLAALHSRNGLFGENSCYACHADYGMFGAVFTKVNGMKHVAAYLSEYQDMPLEQAIPTIHVYKPFPNATCMHCHSTRLPGFLDEPDHQALAEDLRSGKVGCAGAGCHGPPHAIPGRQR